MQATKEISFEEFASNLERVLASLEKGGDPVIFEWHGRRYCIADARLVDPFANYDPERALAAIRKAAGAWKGLDTEAMKAEYRADRGHGPDDDLD